MTITQSGGNNITLQVPSGAPTITVDSFSISNASTNSITVTSTDNPTSKNYVDVYINGVYQAKQISAP